MEKLREWISAHANARNGIIALLAMVVLAFWGGSTYRDWQAEAGGLQLAEVSATTTENADTDTPPETAPATEVAVHVTGEVATPGVYTLHADARINDAVRLANPTADADLDQLNLAQHVTDGMKIIVPKVGDTASTSTTTETATTASTSSGSALININTATAEELEDLPNIGETRAQAIIAYREEHGFFATPEDLKKVSGIGSKTYESLADQITV